MTSASNTSNLLPDQVYGEEEQTFTMFTLESKGGGSGGGGHSYEDEDEISTTSSCPIQTEDSYCSDTETEFYGRRSAKRGSSGARQKSAPVDPYGREMKKLLKSLEAFENQKVKHQLRREAAAAANAGGGGGKRVWDSRKKRFLHRHNIKPDFFCQFGPGSGPPPAVAAAAGSGHLQQYPGRGGDGGGSSSKRSVSLDRSKGGFVMPQKSSVAAISGQARQRRNLQQQQQILRDCKDKNNNNRNRAPDSGSDKRNNNNNNNRSGKRSTNGETNVKMNVVEPGSVNLALKQQQQQQKHQKTGTVLLPPQQQQQQQQQRHHQHTHLANGISGRQKETKRNEKNEGLGFSYDRLL